MRGEIYAPVNINTCTCILYMQCWQLLVVIEDWSLFLHQLLLVLYIYTIPHFHFFLYLFLEYIFSSSSGFITKTMHMWKETQKWYIMCVIC